MSTASDKNLKKSLVIVRAYGDMPVARVFLCRVGEAVEVAPNKAASPALFRLSDVYQFEPKLFKAMEDAFHIRDSGNLVGFWNKANANKYRYSRSDS
jgi:hypothetical protein